MLDKTIDFHSIIMKSENKNEVYVHPLPEGFYARGYKPGDNKHWAKIQYEVGEFDSYESALKCFEHYLEDEELLAKRIVFIVEEKTELPVAVAIAWHKLLNGKQIGVVNGLSCLPAYQKLGLGRIVAEYMMNIFYKELAGCEVWLDTQSWSYVAIGIYLQIGFVPMKKATYNSAKNEFEDACRVMKGKMRADVYEKFIQSAI